MGLNLRPHPVYHMLLIEQHIKTYMSVVGTF